jgi:hypothetical protein
MSIYFCLSCDSILLCCSILQIRSSYLCHEYQQNERRMKSENLFASAISEHKDSRGMQIRIERT